MNKKSQLTQQYLKAFVIIAATGIVLFLLLSNINKQSDYLLHKSQCKQSVQLSASIGKLSDQFATSVKCPVWQTTLTDNPATDAGQASIKAQLANYMADAWDVFLQGKQNLFSDENVYCSVYAIIDFKNKGQKISGLTDFLAKQKLPNQDVTYLDYLSGYSTPDSSNLFSQNTALETQVSQNDIIDTDKTYGIVFVYDKRKDFINRAKDYLGGSFNAAFLSGAAVGALALAFTPAGWVIAGATGVALSAVTIYSVYTAGSTPEWISYVILGEYNPQLFSKLGCTNLPVVQGNVPAS